MSIKTYEHAVIIDGVLYPANTPIEVKEPEKKAVNKNDKGTSRKAKVRDND